MYSLTLYDIIKSSTHHFELEFTNIKKIGHQQNPAKNPKELKVGCTDFFAGGSSSSSTNCLMSSKEASNELYTLIQKKRSIFEDCTAKFSRGKQLATVLNGFLKNMCESTHKRVASVCQGIGVTFIPILLYIAYGDEEFDCNQEGKIVRKYAKILFDKLSSFNLSLDAMRGHEVLIRHLLWILKEEESFPIRLNSILILKNLSKNNRNKILLARFPRLFQLLRDIVFSNKFNDEALKTIVAQLLYHLSWEITNKPLMAQPNCIDIVVYLACEKSYNIKIPAAGCIHQLSSFATNKVILVKYMDGHVLDCLLSLSQDIIKRQSSLLAVRALSNLACRQTASIMVRHNGLIATLGSISMDCLLDDIAVEAANAMRKIGTFINKKDPSHKKVVNTLFNMSRTTENDVLKHVLHALAMQSFCHEKNSNMIHQFQFIVILAQVSLYEERENISVRKLALDILGNISVHKKVAEFVIKRHSSMLSKFGKIYFSKKSNGGEQLSKSIIKLFIILAKHQQNRKELFKIKGIIDSVMAFARSNNKDSSLKLASIQVILLLNSIKPTLSTQ